MSFEKEKKMTVANFGVGRVLETGDSVFVTFPAGERIKLALCEWNGLGGYKGLAIMKVHTDGSMTEYGVGKSAGHVKKIWKNSVLRLK